MKQFALSLCINLSLWVLVCLYMHTHPDTHLSKGNYCFGYLQSDFIRENSKRGSSPTPRGG